MKRFRSPLPVRSLLLIGLVLATSVSMSGGTASAAPTPVGLGTATSFAIRAGDSVTNVPTSAIDGDVGLSPAAGTFYTDTTMCSQKTAGSTFYAVDSTSLLPCVVNNAGLMTTVRSDARAAFVNTSNLPGATPTGDVNNDLAGLTLVPGLYSFGHGTTSNLGGTLTLDAQGDANAVWILQASSDLVTASSSVVSLINGANPCNVYWTVQSSATLNSSSTFVGTILASASITVLRGVTVNGRLLAANQASGAGLVSLIADTITRPPGCTALPAGTGGGPATPAAPPATPVGTPPTFTG